MRRRKKNQGMSLIELMIALTVLTIGLAAVVGLLMTGIASNTRSRLDTGATMSAQAILETIAGQPGGTDVNMTDCAGNDFVVKTAGPAIGAATGATLMTDGTQRIDFAAQTNAAVPTGYKVIYVGCGPNGSRVSYDVRWNIQTITAYSKLVSVGAQQLGGVAAINTSTRSRYFNPPVNLRTIVATGN